MKKEYNIGDKVRVKYLCATFDCTIVGKRLGKPDGDFIYDFSDDSGDARPGGVSCIIGPATGEPYNGSGGWL